jgi:YHS domain-containing protein
MPKVMDVVCGMMVDTDTAASRSTFDGTTYYFCTVECRDLFEANPARYTARGETADSSTGSDKDVELERHEPPFTKSGPIVAPKFGSAGSGGAEFEPGPERHGKRK